jgi:hypothetical protein
MDIKDLLLSLVEIESSGDCAVDDIVESTRVDLCNLKDFGIGESSGL